MKVTRITLDSELGLVELTTGPGGDGNYVLLPIDVPPTAERYLRFPGEPTVEAAQDEEVMTNEDRPYSGMRESAAEARGEAIVAPGGWSVPADQAYDFNTTPGQGAYDAVLEDFPKIERGGTLYPGSKAAKERELNSYLAASVEQEPVKVWNSGGEVTIPECDGNCGAHVKPKWQEPDTGPGRGERDGGFWKTDGPVRERHTGPATVPDPVHVFATNYGHGYRLTCPALPQWTRTINQYDLHRVPGLIAAAMGGKKTVSVTIIEEQ